MVNKGITYFNWDELRVAGRKDIAAIICLAYGITLRYNELSAKTLRTTLTLNRIPPFLFHSQYFIQHKHMLQCTYNTKEPQSYIRNPNFLWMGVPLRDKIVYLRALSLRRISEDVNYIPRRYYTKVTHNIFMDIQEDRIYFPYEK